MLFRLPWKIFLTVLPFGLKNADATYKLAMTSIFHDMLCDCLEDFVDDIIVKSKEVFNHVGDLGKVFRSDDQSLWFGTISLQILICFLESLCFFCVLVFSSFSFFCLFCSSAQSWNGWIRSRSHQIYFLSLFSYSKRFQMLQFKLVLITFFESISFYPVLWYWWSWEIDDWFPKYVARRVLLESLSSLRSSLYSWSMAQKDHLKILSFVVDNYSLDSSVLPMTLCQQIPSMRC